MQKVKYFASGLGVYANNFKIFTVNGKKHLQFLENNVILIPSIVKNTQLFECDSAEGNTQGGSYE